MLHEVWIIREVVVFAVLEDEDAVVFQKSSLKDEAGNRRQFLQSVWRICEDEIKLPLARFDIAEHITPETLNIEHSCVPLVASVLRPSGTLIIVSLKLLQTLLDEAMMVTVEFNADNTATAT